MKNTGSNAMKHALQDDLVALAKYVQELVTLEYERVNWTPEPESALAQEGLRNGLDVVEDYLAHNEPGVALEHLLYMIEETGVALDKKYQTRLTELAKTLGKPRPMCKPMYKPKDVC